MSKPWKPVQKISPFLWFDGNAEVAVSRYVDIFPNSRITSIARYTRESAAVSGQPEGQVMTVGFVLDGQEFGAINGGPHFTFTEAISFVVNCATQDEVDYYWDELCQGGDARAQQCGWLKDEFGVSWQVVPVEMFELMEDADSVKAARVAKALFGMKKIDLQELRIAHGGG